MAHGPRMLSGVKTRIALEFEHHELRHATVVVSE